MHSVWGIHKVARPCASAGEPTELVFRHSADVEVVEVLVLPLALTSPHCLCTFLAVALFTLSKPHLHTPVPVARVEGSIS